MYSYIYRIITDEFNLRIGNFMIQFEELKLELERTKPEIDDLADALGLKAMESEIQQLENRATEPGFWDDMEKSGDTFSLTN